MKIQYQKKAVRKKRLFSATTAVSSGLSGGSISGEIILGKISPEENFIGDNIFFGGEEEIVRAEKVRR